MITRLFYLYQYLPYVVLISFFLGTLPSGPVVARLRGVDLRMVGSGNVGATNVYRALGRNWAIVVFLADTLKGFLPVVGAGYFLGEPVMGMLAGICAVSGHVFNPLYDFRGGKGIATSFGAMLGIFPLAALLSLITWAMVTYQTRIVSLASISASLSLPFFTLLVTWEEPYTRSALLAAFILAGLTLSAHRENIKRLLAGEEKNIGREKAKGQSDD